MCHIHLLYMVLWIGGLVDTDWKLVVIGNRHGVLGCTVEGAINNVISS